jgi:predicted peptidase
MKRLQIETVRALAAVASVAAWIAIGVAGVSTQTTETGFLNRSVLVDGKPRRYQVYVPRDYPESSSLPIILALHGGADYGDDGLLQTDGGLARAIRRHTDRFRAIVVFPQSPSGGTPGFQALGERIALAALDRSLTEFKADASRVYLTGLSMGGNGAWYLAYHHPERFAALVVVCGFVGEFTGTTSGVHYPPIVPASSGDPYTAIAKRVARLPIWIFHGDADATVPVDVSRRMASALKAIGADVQYTELPGVGHNAWIQLTTAEICSRGLFKQQRRQ